MKRRIGILLAMVILMGIPIAVKASEISGSGDTNIKSYGNIFYEDATGSVRLYSEDIALLQEKLASVPGEIFDPVLYSHTHIWEYFDITDKGHIRHCNVCGSRYDIAGPHIVERTEPCTISSNGQEYLGYDYTCECGYQWKMEVDHHPVFTSKNDTYHTVTCALDGTSYCTGMTEREDLHEITLCFIDGSHHQKVCDACGHMGDVEACTFEIEREVETGDAEAEIEIRKYCECGNYIVEPKEDATDPDVVDPDVTETEDTKTEPEEEEKQYDSEKEESNEDNSVILDKNEVPEISVSGNDIGKDAEGEYNL